MALTQKWTTEKYYTSESNSDDVIKKNETYDKSYIVVSCFDGQKTKASFMISVFEDDSKEKLVTRQVYDFSHDASSDSANILTQAYMYLKTLPEFADAADC